MHEYHAVEAVVERLRNAHLDDITEVRVRVGAAYSPVALRQAYEMLTLGTALQTSRLVIERAAEERVCPSCANPWLVTDEDLAGHLALCPTCGTPTPVEDGTRIDVIGISP